MASEPMRDPLTVLDAWREQGADGLDPLRFRFIEALALRAAGHDGEARRLLDDRLRGLMQAYGDAIERAACPAGTAPAASASASPLASLVDALASRAPTAIEPAFIDYFRDTWTRVSAVRQVRQSLEHVPENAGPLNSSHLVHRALSLMRQQSPGYLEQFLSYVDALSWLEQIVPASAPAAGETPRVGVVKKGVRSKPRGRR